MENLRTCFVVAVGALAACGGSNVAVDAHIIDSSADAKVFMDAPIDSPPVYDFSCIGVAPPTTGDDPVAVSGLAQEISASGIAALATNPVTACKLNCTGGVNQLATATTDSTGAFTLTGIATGGNALDAYVKVAKSGDRTTLVFPYAPFVKDLANMPALIFTTAAFDFAVQFLASNNQDAGNGTLALAVVDCANTPITDTNNITLTVKQGATDVPNTTTIDLGLLAAQVRGTFVVFNVPPSVATEVNAAYMGTTLRTFRPHAVRVEAATTTETLVRPGYSP